MKKSIVFSIVGLLALVAILGGIKGLQINRMIAQGEQRVPPPETVTTATVQSQTWSSILTAVGSLEAVEGVTISAELKGKVVKITFEPGSKVKTGDLLVQQDISLETAQLRSAEASMKLARLNLERSKKLLPEKVITRSDFDATEAKFKQAAAEVDQIRATIDKKTIRAPFAGRLGIRMINLGQNLNEGDAIVSLQTMDPIYVNFQLPQQELHKIRQGLKVQLTGDALPEAGIAGKITAVNPQVDAATRNVRVQATVSNAHEQLHPGMFVNVTVVLPKPQNVLAIPATAVLYAPYSDSVFIVEDQKKGKAKGSGKVVRQQFVRLGEKRGDYITVDSGLKEGQVVVSTGVFKLRNGQSVVVDNSLAPEFKLAPQPADA
jgi:membrane fusion protein (multidrug efflux system)